MVTSLNEANAGADSFLAGVPEEATAHLGNKFRADFKWRKWAVTQFTSKCVRYLAYLCNKVRKIRGETHGIFTTG